VQILSAHPNATVDYVKDYLVRQLQKEQRMTADDQKLIKAYREDQVRMQTEIEEIRTRSVCLLLRLCVLSLHPVRRLFFFRCCRQPGRIDLSSTFLWVIVALIHPVLFLIRFPARGSSSRPSAPRAARRSTCRPFTSCACTRSTTAASARTSRSARCASSGGSRPPTQRVCLRLRWPSGRAHRPLSSARARAQVCEAENMKVAEMNKALLQKPDLHDGFFKMLESAHDGFSVISEYYGKGIFSTANTMKAITQRDQCAPSALCPDRFVLWFCVTMLGASVPTAVPTGSRCAK
jgi:hypothetical protein